MNQKRVFVAGATGVLGRRVVELLESQVGRALLGAANTTTCNNWTSSGAGRAMVGHHDRLGGGNTSWNAVHLSRSCSQADLVATGGNGLFYCFAID